MSAPDAPAPVGRRWAAVGAAEPAGAARLTGVAEAAPDGHLGGRPRGGGGGGSTG